MKPSVCQLTFYSGSPTKSLLPEDWALSEAEVLVWADMRGLSSHGVLRIPPYLTWMEGGLRNPNADIHIIAEKGAMVLLEADRAPGLHTMRMAMDTAIERARVHGIGWVNVRQTTHTGPMGFYVRQAAQAGMIGIATCSSRPLMAYHGTRDMARGTAPLAIAAPRANSEPLVLDMASAAVSIGAIWAARQTGTALPEGTAVDETTSAVAATAFICEPFSNLNDNLLSSSTTVFNHCGRL